MPTVEKDVLRPGTYKLRDGSTHTFTAQDVRACAANGRRMMDAGEAVPLIWEHDLDAVPIPLENLLASVDNPRDWTASFAKNCFGHIAGFKLVDEDGVPVLYSVNEVYKAEDAEKWKAARFCSPRIDRDYMDGQGRIFPGASVTHLAATPKPVQTNQFPVMLSATPGSSRVPFRGTTTIFLSADGDKPMADPKKDDADGGKPEGKSGVESRLKNVLAQLGHTIPDSATDMETICISLEALAANGGAAGGTVDDGDGDDFNPDNPDGGDGMATAGTGDTTPASAPMMMSVMNAYRKQLGDRVQKIAKRGMAVGVIDGVYARDLERKVTGAQLSLTKAGDLQRSELVQEIDTVERLVNNAWTAAKGKPGKRGTGPVNLSRTAGVQLPNPNGMSDEQLAMAVQKAKEDTERRLGIPAAAAKK